MKEVTIPARFPEQRYLRNGQPIEIVGTSQGSALGVAMNRAVRVILQSPDMRRKSPLQIYLSVAIDCEQPIQFSKLFQT
jgi:hypothetical protein